MLEAFENNGKKLSEANFPFVDVEPQSWFSKQASIFYLNGYINGYPDLVGLRFFKPNNSITRAEFLRLLVKFSGLSCEPTSCKSNPYIDVKNNEWFFEYINIAFEKELLDGSRRNFEPYRAISRSEAIALIVRAKDKNKESCDFRENDKFSDVSGSDWFNVPICIAKKYRWVDGYNNPNICTPKAAPCARPSALLTRAEAVALLDKTFPQ